MLKNRTFVIIFFHSYNDYVNRLLYFDIFKKGEKMVTYYKDKNLPNRFKECRIAMKLTQPQLSSLLGFKGGKATIMSYEKSKRLPNVNTIIRMHEVLKVSTDYLLCIDDYKDHNDYMDKVLGIDDELLSLLNSIIDYNKIKRINLFIHRHYKDYVYET